MDWKMDQAKRDFQNGLLVGYEIQRAPMSAGRWQVALRTDSTVKGYLIDARRKAPRLFATLDAAVSELERIGFRVESMR